ncbi:hypothetical protein AB0H86_05490 [Streptomyces sp. NPDC050997]|uniref:hypothetical protein n=1 Tax=Streptomyces sp. NPDC050997 TaxID=3155519 RepID=UPI003423FB31
MAFTGVATYYGARVSQDQLDQSIEDSEREARSQATQVSFWFEGQGTENLVLHVMNRSPDPVGASQMRFQLRIFSADESEPDTMASAQIILDPLPPCSLQTIEPGQLRTRSADGERAKLPRRIMYVTDRYFAFRDRNGRGWGRLDDRLVSMKALAKYEPVHNKVAVELVGTPKRISAPECGDNAK